VQKFSFLSADRRQTEGITDNPRRAGFLFLFSTPFGVAAFFPTKIDYLRHGAVLWYYLLGDSFLALVVFAVPGVFWLGTHRLNWAPVISGPASRWQEYLGSRCELSSDFRSKLTATNPHQSRIRAIQGKSYSWPGLYALSGPANSSPVAICATRLWLSYKRGFGENNRGSCFSRRVF
jgi:hypothetical protein